MMTYCTDVSLHIIIIVILVISALGFFCNLHRHCCVIVFLNM